MERKYIYEAGLDVFTSFANIVPVEHLEKVGKIDSHKYHIYSILAYHQFYFKKEKTYCTPEGVQITLFATIDGHEVEYELPLFSINKISMNAIKVELNMPYTSLTISVDNEEFLQEHPEYYHYKKTMYAQDLFMIFASKIVKKTEFKVLYIGQAFGKEGRRTAFDRLESHSTLQKILIDCQAKYADKHIYVMLMEFTPQLLSVFDGISETYTKTEEESDQHMHEVLSNLPELDQVINITEAALINYFKPEYNINFVENFPDENHKGYRQYFDLDYNALSVEINLEFDGLNCVQLYTETNNVKTAYDFIQYQLYNDNNRLNMYDIFKEEKNS